MSRAPLRRYCRTCFTRHSTNGRGCVGEVSLELAVETRVARVEVAGKFQFGYYATQQLRNEVWHVAIRKADREELGMAEPDLQAVACSRP
jgi:hypothetical protein